MLQAFDKYDCKIQSYDVQFVCNQKEFVMDTNHSKSNICATSSDLCYARVGLARPEFIEKLSDKSMPMQ